MTNNHLLGVLSVTGSDFHANRVFIHAFTTEWVRGKCGSGVEPWLTARTSSDDNTSDPVTPAAELLSYKSCSLLIHKYMEAPRSQVTQ